MHPAWNTVGNYDRQKTLIQDKSASSRLLVILGDPVWPCLFCTWSSSLWGSWNSHLDGVVPTILGDPTALHLACNDPGVNQAPIRISVTSCCFSVAPSNITKCRQSEQRPTTGELHVVRGRPDYLGRAHQVNSTTTQNQQQCKEITAFLTDPVQPGLFYNHLRH